MPAQQRLAQDAGLEQVAHAHGTLDRVGVALVELVAHRQRRPARAALCGGRSRFGKGTQSYRALQSQLWHARRLCCAAFSSIALHSYNKCIPTHKNLPFVLASCESALHQKQACIGCWEHLHIKQSALWYSLTYDGISVTGQGYH